MSEVKIDTSKMDKDKIYSANLDKAHLEAPVAIVIPTRNSGQWLKLTIDSIYRTIRSPFKVIIVDSKSTDGTKEWCREFAEQQSNFEIHDVEFDGTTKAINYGIKLAGDLDVLLTQDDVIFHFFINRDILMDFKYNAKRKNVGIVTVDNGGGTSGPMYLDGFKWSGTWCMFIPKKTRDIVGLLDENLNPGDGDDIDYSYAVIKKGLALCFTDMFVEHHRKFTVSEHEHEDQKIKEKNSAYFRKKWNLDIPTLISCIAKPK